MNNSKKKEIPLQGKEIIPLQKESIVILFLPHRNKITLHEQKKLVLHTLTQENNILQTILFTFRQLDSSTWLGVIVEGDTSSE